MRKISISFFAAVLFVSCATTPAPEVGKKPDFGAFVDEVMTREMKRQSIPGAAVVFVRDGRVVYAKGYGFADVATGRPVDAETIWRIGSITKTFTAVAVMQLADKSAIDLRTDANVYLRQLKIPDTYPLPVSVRDLVTHTSGFDEIRPGTQAASRDEVLPLDDFLRSRLVRIRPAGDSIAYTTYGVTLAGKLIEDVSGQDYESYLRQHIWTPLGMDDTSIHIPPGKEGRVAIGYELEKGAPVAQAWEWYHTVPASSINATIGDMARYMTALLEDSALLSSRSRAEVLRQQVTMHPRLPGVTVGFFEDFLGELRLVEHGGNMAGLSALMILIPEHRAGLFIVNHLEGSNLRDNVKQEILEHLFPQARNRKAVPTPPADFESRAKLFAGRYVPTWGCRTCNPRTTPFILEIKAEPDAIRLSGRRWIEVEPLLFVREDGTGYVSFKTDPTGKIVQMHVGGMWNFERVSD